MSLPLRSLFLVVALAICAMADRLSDFYSRLSQSDVKYCADKTKLLPNCNQCIPGMQPPPGKEACTEYIPSSKSIRDEIRNLVVKRFGDSLPANRTFGLYPCKFEVF